MLGMRHIYRHKRGEEKGYESPYGCKEHCERLNLEAHLV